MLLDARNYIKDRGGVASLAELGRHFDITPDAMKCILKHWLAKGKIIKLPQKGCRGCTQCAPETLEFYQWVDENRII